VAALAIGASGALSAVPGSPFAGGAVNSRLVITPDGRYLYGVSSSAGTLFGFSVAADGTVGAVPGLPVALGSTPIGLAVSSDRRQRGRSLTATATASITPLAGGATEQITTRVRFVRRRF
jgi:hypothetical protein